MGDHVAPILSSLLRTLPTRSQSDERLASLVRGGDDAAFAALYERYHRSLYRYCLSMLRDPDDARDALQTAMEHALTGLRRAPLDGLVRPWLYRIAHNEAITIIRRRHPLGGELPEVAAPAWEQPEPAVLLRADVAALIRDMRDLSERQRTALLMHELGGLAYAEIGSALSISPGAARQAALEARLTLTELDRGREEDCDGVQRKLADGDRRTLGARRMRGHLSACSNCSAFNERLESRRRVLSLVPPPTAATAAAVLQALLGGGAAATGGAALAPVALKLAATVAGTAAAAFGTIHALHVVTPPHHDRAAVERRQHAGSTVRAAPLATSVAPASALRGSSTVRTAQVHRAESAARGSRQLVAQVTAPRRQPTQHGTGGHKGSPPSTSPAPATVSTPTVPVAAQPSGPDPAALALAAQRAEAQRRQELALLAAQHALAAAQQMMGGRQQAGRDQLQTALALAQQQVQAAVGIAQQAVQGTLGAILARFGGHTS